MLLRPAGLLTDHAGAVGGDEVDTQCGDPPGGADVVDRPAGGKAWRGFQSGHEYLADFGGMFELQAGGIDLVEPLQLLGFVAALVDAIEL